MLIIVIVAVVLLAVVLGFLLRPSSYFNAIFAEEHRRLVL